MSYFQVTSSLQTLTFDIVEVSPAGTHLLVPKYLTSSLRTFTM